MGSVCAKSPAEQHEIITEKLRSEYGTKPNPINKLMLFDDFAIDSSYIVPNEFLNNLEGNIPLVNLFIIFRMVRMRVY